ncbi:MAG: hypothetical protein ABIA62_04365 [Candidatus Woesearchaeota archaeon]
MKVKTYMGSKFCYLLLKIRIPEEWTEQLELLVQISGLKNMDEYIKTILAWKLLTQTKAIEKQRKKNIQEEKEIREYWEWKNRKE